MQAYAMQALRNQLFKGRKALTRGIAAFWVLSFTDILAATAGRECSLSGALLLPAMSASTT